VGSQDGGEGNFADGFAQRVMGFASLDQCADNLLSCVFSPEPVGPFLGCVVVSEKWRMARVGDKPSYVLAVGKDIGVGCGGVEANGKRVRAHLGYPLFRDGGDVPVGHRKEDRFGVGNDCFRVYGVNAAFRKTLPAGGGRFHGVEDEFGVFCQSSRDSEADLAPCAEQGDIGWIHCGRFAIGSSGPFFLAAGIGSVAIAFWG